MNKEGKIERNSALPFLVFHFVAHYNLSDLELFFRLAGFSAFEYEELPDSIIKPQFVGLSNRKNLHIGLFGGFTDEKEAKKFIESKLGEGIILQFMNIKHQKLLYEKSKLLEKLRNTEQEIGELTSPVI